MFKKIFLLSALLSTTSAFSADMKFVCSAYVRTVSGNYKAVVSVSDTKANAFLKLLTNASASYKEAQITAPVVQVGDNYVLATVLNACSENL